MAWPSVARVPLPATPPRRPVHLEIRAASCVQSQPAKVEIIAIWEGAVGATADVRFGSLADIRRCRLHVRFTPESGHPICTLMSTRPKNADAEHRLCAEASEAQRRRAGWGEYQRFSLEFHLSPHPGSLVFASLRRASRPSPSRGGWAPSSPHRRRIPAVCTAIVNRSVGPRERVWAHLVRRAAVRIPVLPAAPDPLAGRLRLPSQLGHIDAGDAAILHPHHAVDDHGVDIVADAAVDKALDRIAHRPEAKRVAAAEINDDDVRLGARSQPPDVVAADGVCTAQGGRLENLRGGGGLEVPASHLAEVGGVAQLQDHVARIGVGAERNVHARLPIRLPAVEEAPAPRHVDRTVRDRATVRTHDLQIVRAGVVHQRVVAGEVAVADVELVRHQADLAQELHRGHLVLADDVEHLVDVVGGMDRDRQVALPCDFACLAHQRNGAGLDLARHQDAAHEVAMGALVAIDEFEREIEFPLARGFIHDANELAAVPADPAAAVKARTEIGADAELADDLEQRLLDAQLAPELHECGDAVAQKLRHRVAGIEQQLFGDRIVVGTDITRIAAHARARARDADLEKRLAEIVAAADIRDQPMRGAMARVHMGVDEPRSDQLVARVDLTVHPAFEALADELHGVAFIDQLGVAPERMTPVGMTDQPAAVDPRSHEKFLTTSDRPYTDNLRR